MGAREHLQSPTLASSTPAFRQLVLVGAGLDFRPIRLAERLHDCVVFEVDLTDMLAERGRLLSLLAPKHGCPRRIPVSCDLELQDLALQLAFAGFNPNLNTLFVLEGLTMYLDAAVNDKLFAALGALSSSAGSRVWVR